MGQLAKLLRDAWHFTYSDPVNIALSITYIRYYDKLSFRPILEWDCVCDVRY